MKDLIIIILFAVVLTWLVPMMNRIAELEIMADDRIARINAIGR
jgi:hypothetical protein